MAVKCSNCGATLGEDYSTEPRKPCPTCGSTVRQFILEVETGHYEIIGSDVQINVIRNVASLLMQAVIVFGAKTNEGQLIEAVTLPWFEIIGAITRNPSLVFQIEPRKWEEIIAGAYQKAGFDEVTLTPRSGDFGRDIIAVKRGLGIVRIIDQVKAYKPTHLVTADDVRALLGVLQGDKASKGFLTTTSDFAPTLREDILLKPFMPAQLELINGEMLLTRLKELKEKTAYRLTSVSRDEGENE
jgi:restriction system protein